MILNNTTMVDYLNPNIHWRARIRGLGPKDQLGCLHGILFLLMAAALLVVAAMFAGCTTTQYVPVPEYHTDTTYITKQQRDSIWLHDSTYIHDRGDTVLIERWRTKYVERMRIDTLYKHKIDSVAVPYQVPATLSRWQRFCCDYGKIMLGMSVALILLAAGLIVRRIRSPTL